MSDITLTIDGLPELLKAIDEANAEVREAAEREVMAATFRVQTSAIKRIQRGPATGEVYEKYNPRRTHQASGEGQAPQTDTGRLVASIQSNVDGLNGVVFSDVDYAPMLEFGTSKMAARPWLLPSVEEDAPRFLEGLRGILK